AGPIQDFGELPGSAGPVRVLSGRFGPYVTDGEVNATLPRGTDPATISADDALDLLKKKREAGPSTRRPVKRRASSTRKK
ncbi:MAG TPA: topoisomerase C-terminal repeat-containing protein, partial [Fimbriimonadaceae bacterium]|nr:topoisomerase C-terminal repeat-containing protein [Fimbriimonadaceae bacterium]